MNCSEDPAGNLKLWNTDTVRRPNTSWVGPSDLDRAIFMVPFVPPLYGRPQGEMLRALCISLIPVFKGESNPSQSLFSETFSDLLTRRVSPFHSPRQ